MSHSTVLVIGPATEDDLTAALAPFYEGDEVEPYIASTKLDQIARRRMRQEQAAENARLYLAKEPPYHREGYDRRDHIAWILRDAPAEAALDDAALWTVILDKESYEERDENGAIWSTYNPKSRWDWYAIGGRWAGALKLHNGAGVSQIDRIERINLDTTNPTLAVLTPDGEWHEQGRMGWFGVVHDQTSDDDWAPTWRAIVEKHLDQPAFLVDVHI